MMRRSLTLALAAVVGALALPTCPSHAQSPDRPLKIIVPFGAGSSTDQVTRELAQVLSGILKQTVVVDNRAGADGSIGGMAVVNSEPDGHTALLTSSSVSVLDPIMRKVPIIDPLKDLTPVCAISRIGMGVWISGDLPFKTMGEFIAAAKAEPGKYTFGYSSTTTRLSGELFQQLAGVQMRAIPYKTSMAGLTDVGSGQISMMVNDPYSSAGLYQSGKLRPLVIAAPQRLKVLASVPSSPEVGLAGFDVIPWFGMFLPAKTPAPVVARLREAVAQALKSPQMAAFREKGGMEEMNLCGDDVAKLQAAEMATWSQVIKKAGIELQ